MEDFRAATRGIPDELPLKLKIIRAKSEIKPILMMEKEDKVDREKRMKIKAKRIRNKFSAGGTVSLSSEIPVTICRVCNSACVPRSGILAIAMRCSGRGCDYTGKATISVVPCFLVR